MSSFPSRCVVNYRDMSSTSVTAVNLSARIRVRGRIANINGAYMDGACASPSSSAWKDHVAFRGDVDGGPQTPRAATCQSSKIPSLPRAEGGSLWGRPAGSIPEGFAAAPAGMCPPNATAFQSGAACRKCSIERVLWRQVLARVCREQSYFLLTVCRVYMR